MLTEQEIERRRQFVTATDTPALLGESPWVNANDVYIAKVHGTIWQGNAATEAGSLLEPAVREWSRSQLGQVHDGDWRVHEGGLLACTLDGVTADGQIVECKTSGIVGPGSPHQWGAEGTDEIPSYYLIQVQTQMLVTGANRAWVPTLIGNRGFVMYVVEANEELQSVILAQAEAFWIEHVAPKIPPSDVRPHLDVLKRMLRVPGKTVSVADELADEYLRLKEEAKLANERADDAQAALIAEIGDGEVAKWSHGEFTFKEQVRKSFVVEESKFRVLRAKPNKGAKCLTAN